MSTAASGRVVCAHCRANNFDTQAACWKCGAPLPGGPLGAAGPAPAQPRVSAQAPSDLFAAPAAAVPAPTVDPAVAHWVGVIGGLLIPFAMLPIGLAFLMWDDRRKVEVGRTATIASLIGTAIHLAFTFVFIYGSIRQLLPIFGGIGSRAQAAQTEKAPDWNAPAKPLDLSGIPSLSPPQR